MLLNYISAIMSNQIQLKSENVHWRFLSLWHPNWYKLDESWNVTLVKLLINGLGAYTVICQR